MYPCQSILVRQESTSQRKCNLSYTYYFSWATQCLGTPLRYPKLLGLLLNFQTKIETLVAYCKMLNIVKTSELTIILHQNSGPALEQVPQVPGTCRFFKKAFLYPKFLKIVGIWQYFRGEIIIIFWLAPAHFKILRRPCNLYVRI